MWFKNLRIYRLTKTFPFTSDELNAALDDGRFTPCGKLDPFKFGWVPPLGRHGSELIHTANGYTMICAKRQEKILPAGVIKEHLDEKILEIQDQEGRRISRKERDGMKDEIIFSLMPRAFVKSSLHFAFIPIYLSP